MGEAWIGLVGALSGILVTSFFGLVIAFLKHRWEDSSQREQRLYRLGEARAESRRGVYTRFLTAAEELGDYALAQPPHKDGRPTSLEEARQRLRELRTSGDAHFSAYNSALLEALLLAGEDVARVLDAFDSWVSDQFVAGLMAGDAAEAEAFFDMSEERVPLIEAMRREQAKDLAA